jgi:hypothetical protein
MTRWFPPTQIIIVHGRQIVVNETHGMNHFQRNSGRHGRLIGSGKHLAGGQTEDGSNALATRHQTVLHGFANLFRFGLIRNDRGIQGRFNGREFALNVNIQVKGFCDFFWSRGGRLLLGNLLFGTDSRRRGARNGGTGKGWSGRKRQRRRSHRDSRQDSKRKRETHRGVYLG